MTRQRMLSRLAVAVSLLLLLPSHVAAQDGRELPASTVIYFVRHGEATDGSLNDQGRARAEAFLTTVREVRFTHVFSSHTRRATQMVEPVATARGLSVVQLPQPGTIVGNVEVKENSPSGVAVAPMIDALRRVPPGSTVLPGGNRENIFAALNGLGVLVCSTQSDAECVPCLTAACWGEWFDWIWVITVTPRPRPRMMELHYAATPGGFSKP